MMKRDFGIPRGRLQPAAAKISLRSGLIGSPGPMKRDSLERGRKRRSDGGGAMIVTTFFMLLLSFMAYLIMTHSQGVRAAGRNMKNAESAQLMLSLRNVLIEDAVGNGGLRDADPNNSLPSYLMNPNFNVPVKDIWGSEIKYCVYNEINRPAAGLAGRLLSAGENKKFQTACSDVTAKGDDIAIDILSTDVNSAIAHDVTWSPPLMVGANNASSFLVREDGSLWAWGANNNYALQDGTTINRRFPVQSLNSANVNDFVSNVKEVSAGVPGGFVMLKNDTSVWAATYNAALYPVQIPLPFPDASYIQNAGWPASGMLTGEPANGMAVRNSDGSVWAWGANSPSRALTKAGVLSTAISVSPGKVLYNSLSGHALALLSNYTVWAWGYNNYGQLGDGSTTTRLKPVQVSGLGSGVLAVSAGTSHSLALKFDGTVWAWGYNNYGQLGDNTTGTRTAPVQVHGPNNVGYLTGVIAIAAGESHSMALKSDGTVWMWGYNNYSQLGDNTTSTRNTPVQVHGINNVGYLTGVAAIAAGARHSLALKSDGTACAWGYNANGQLGDGTNTSTSSQTYKCPIYVMVDIANGIRLSGAVALSAGGNHSLALESDGTVSAWGYNISGQLGDGTTTSQNTAVSVMADPTNGIPLGGVVSLSAGAGHSMALKSDGTVWTWGSNSTNYELGDEPLPPSTPVNRATPVQSTRLSGITAIAAGGGNSFAIDSATNLWTWGRGWPSIFTPAPIWGQNGVGTLTGITQISVSWSATTAYHCLALKSDGTVWAWGKNTNGRLGDGTTTDRIYPVQVFGLSNIVAVSAGVGHSLALRSDGTLWAWGANSSYQLGDNTNVQKTSPIQVHGYNNSGFLAGIKLTPSGRIAPATISAGNGFSLAVKTDGTVVAWGLNSGYQLGDGTTTSRRTPISIAGVSDVTYISAGGAHSVAVKSTGNIVSWGNNSSGQLGNGSWYNYRKPTNVQYIKYVTPS